MPRFLFYRLPRLPPGRLRRARVFLGFGVPPNGVVVVAKELPPPPPKGDPALPVVPNPPTDAFPPNPELVLAPAALKTFEDDVV